MSDSKQLLEAENAREGRIIPLWRYYTAFFSTWVLGMLAQKLWDHVGVWAFVLTALVVSTVWSLTLARYTKRSIR